MEPKMSHDTDPLFLLREPAQRFALVMFAKMLLEMTEGEHARGTIAQGNWWMKNLQRYMTDGALPRRRDADPRLFADLLAASDT
jgi:hypothetical protein